jgi:hypothetical protein
MSKIAVLLRGQLRFSREGAHLFKKFVIDKFPQHEFDFFFYAPKRISAPPGPGSAFNSINLTGHEAESLVSYWQPRVRYWQFQNEADLFEPIKKITLDLVSDRKLYDWLTYHNARHNIQSKIMSFNLMPHSDRPFGDYKDDFTYNAADILYKSISENEKLLDQTGDLRDILDLNDKIASKANLYHNLVLKEYAIKLHNLMSQYYGFIRSFQLLKNYMKENPYYNPDLVWSTRTDLCHEFAQSIDWDIKFDTMISQLESIYAKDSANNSKVILSNRVQIERNQPYICDLNLFSTVTMLDNIFNLNEQTCKDIIINSTTRNKIHVIKAMEAQELISHTLWSAIFNNASFRCVQNTAWHYSWVIRHNYDPEQILRMTGTEEDIKLLRRMESEFSYPDLTCTLDKDTIIREFEYLSSN